MSNETLHRYIANLPIGAFQASVQPEEDEAVESIDINKLPDGVVAGSNLIQFPKEVSPEVKSSIALSLLAAQRVATNDSALQTPQQWIERHNTVLRNLNWRVEGGGGVHEKFKDINLAVHDAIIPFLTAALGPAAVAGALILTALKQLKDMDRDSPWITLFDQQSRRFDVSEYQFSVVTVKGDQVTLKLASARFDASYGKIQVLFFIIKNQQAEFDFVHQTLSASCSLLAEMNEGLKAKLAVYTKSYIKSLPI